MRSATAGSSLAPVSLTTTSTLPNSARAEVIVCSRAFRYLFHGFDTVHDQVQKHLLQLNAIAHDRSAVRKAPAEGSK